MKTTNNFKKVIENHLKGLAEKDSLFAEKFNNPKKNIKDCVTYILKQVKESGANGFTDDEVYGIAIHYYDEESIDVGAEIKMKVIVNHTVELTEEEKAEAKQKAIDDVISEQRKKMTTKPKKEKTPVAVDKKKESNEPLTLF